MVIHRYREFIPEDTIKPKTNSVEINLDILKSWTFIYKKKKYKFNIKKFIKLLELIK